MHANLLDQLRIFSLIAELGSFSKAARQLDRPVSAVSYAVVTLETHLGLKLFDRAPAGRGLTDEGRTVLQDAEVILRRVAQFDSRVRAMREGENTDIALAVETSFPDGLLSTGLAAFSSLYPFVSVSVTRATAKTVGMRVAEGEGVLGVTLLDAGLQGGRLDGTQIAADVIVIVAGPAHALARMDRPIAMRDLDTHRQIHLHDGPLDRRDFDYRVHGTDVWLVDNLGEQEAFVRSGIGWAFMPRGVVGPALAAGALVTLDCEDVRTPPLRRFAAIWRRDRAPGKIGHDLIRQLADSAPVQII